MNRVWHICRCMYVGHEGFITAGCVVFQVQEGLPAGSLLGTLQAKDPDEGENGTIFYSLSGKAMLLQYKLFVARIKGFPYVTD